MKNSRRMDVVLTQEARALLKDEPIQIYLRNGDYFNCKAIKQNGGFLDMTVEVTHPHKNEALDFMISIPLRFVLYILSAEGASLLGFKADEG